MKLRLYLNNFRICIDFYWDTSTPPQKGDIIFLHDFVNMEKGSSNVKAFEVYEKNVVFTRFKKMTSVLMLHIIK